MKIFICLIALVPSLSFGQTYLTNSRIKLLKGAWISDNDKSWTWVFTDSTAFDVYAGEKEKDKPIPYYIVKDTLMLKDPDVETEMKYEVLGLTKESLSVMYLLNDKIFTFKKRK
jgi:hypothetical protein